MARLKFFIFSAAKQGMKVNKLIVEGIGSFFIVLVLNICILNESGPLSYFAAGMIWAGMVFAGGHLSGAHFNPIVTLAVFIRGKCSASDVPSYIFVQLLGGSLAGLLAGGFLLQKIGQGMDLSVTAGQAILSECIGSFALCWVVLHVTTTRDTLGNSFYGWAIGATYAGLGWALSSVSGSALNPAIALSFGINNISGYNNFWIYFVGELLGAVAAAYVFLVTNGKE